VITKWLHAVVTVMWIASRKVG